MRKISHLFFGLSPVKCIATRWIEKSSEAFSGDLFRLGAFDPLPDPVETIQHHDDDYHTRPQKPMFFQVCARAERTVMAEEMDFCGKEKQNEENQKNDARPIEPFFHCR
jgi:hypothetical protein